MAKARYAVLCKKHGMGTPPHVTVGKPKSKVQRLHGGCPHCKSESVRGVTDGQAS